MTFKNKAQLALIVCLITIAQSVNFCPATGTTSNTIEQKVITLTTAPDFTYTSICKNGVKFYEITASIADKTLSVQVMREDMTPSIQTKTYTNPIEMIGIKNEVVLIKAYSADKSTFTINAIKYDFGNFATTPSAISSEKIITIPAQLTGFYIKKIFTFVQATQQMVVFLASSSAGAVYTISITGGTMAKVGTITSSSVPNLIGGFKGLIFDDTSDQFFTLASSVYTAAVATAVTAGAAFYPTNVQIAHLERETIGILSSDSATTKGILLLSSSGGNNPNVFNAGAIPIKFHTDSISNVLAFSNIKLVWFNVQFSPDGAPKIVIESATATAAGNETLADYATGISYYTSYQRGFVLSSTSLKIFKISGSGIDKLQSIVLSTSMQTSLTASTPQQIVLSFKCTCAVASAPKLICFASNFNCLALTTKGTSDCTTTAQSPV